MFEAFEGSRFGGRPGHLFVFTLQGLTWRFTNGPRDIVIGSNTYLSAPGMARSEIKETSERAQDKITITLPYLLNPNAAEFPATQEFGGIFRPYAPSGAVQVVCMALHVNDGDQQAKVEWMGRVSAPQFSDTQLTLTCEPTRGNRRFRGDTGRFCRGCTVALYSQGRGKCNVLPADHAFSATLTSVSGLALTAAAFGGYDDGRLSGGFIQWTRSNGLVERRDINSHVGTTITINYGGAELAEDLVVTAHPGCAHNYDDCDNYYGNTPNYGGQPQLNSENPFDGHRIAW